MTHIPNAVGSTNAAQVDSATGQLNTNDPGLREAILETNTLLRELVLILRETSGLDFIGNSERNTE